MAKQVSLGSEMSRKIAGSSASRKRKSSTSKSAFSPPAHRSNPFPSGTQVFDSQHGRDSKNTHVDESRAVVMNGEHTNGQSHGETAVSDDEAEEVEAATEDSVSEAEEAMDPEEDHEYSDSTMGAAFANGVHKSNEGDSDVEMDETTRLSSQIFEKDTNTTEPSFGDLLAAKSKKPISVVEAFPSIKPGALIPAESSNAVAVPYGISLSTVLTQALRTNDNNLLESCFHNTDTQIIRSTVQRIDSSLAGILMQKLAERLSSRPGRYGHLLVWVQWICVAHGGAIGGQPDILSKIKTLYQVLNQRSKVLEPLLLLKGKLDMLDAQLGLRKQLLADRGPGRNPDQGHVIYVEGDEGNDSSGDDAGYDDAEPNKPANGRRKGKMSLQDLIGNEEEESEDDEDMPMTNGITAGSEDSDFDSEGEDEGSAGDREGRLVDDEAEESDEDSHPSDREDIASEEEEMEDDVDDEEGSEMDDFIDDGPVEEAESEPDIVVDETPEKPPSKKSRKN